MNFSKQSICIFKQRSSSRSIFSTNKRTMTTKINNSQSNLSNSKHLNQQRFFSSSNQKQQNQNQKQVFESGLYSFGNSLFGQLGNGERDSKHFPMKIPFFDFKNNNSLFSSKSIVTHIACGDHSSYAVVDNTKLFVFGKTIGKNEFVSPQLLFDFKDSNKVKQISSGQSHCLILLGKNLKALCFKKRSKLILVFCFFSFTHREW